MLQPNPNRPPLLLPYEEAAEGTPLTEYERRYIERRSALWPRIGKGALAAVAISTPYWADVGNNLFAEQTAEPSISIVGEALHEANSHKAILLFNGFNTVNANSFGRHLGEAIQQYSDGELWSVQHNNAPMGGKTIYEAAVELAERRGITSLSIASYSMGNIAATETAKNIFVDSPLSIDVISDYSGPSGFDGLTPERQSELELAKNISNWVPGSAHSSFWRYLVELYFYKDVYSKDGFDFSKFTKVSGDIFERFLRGEYTTNSFLLSQIDSLLTADIDNDMARIGENPLNKELPIFTYFSIGENGRDDMVDNTYSARKINAAIGRAGMAGITRSVPGAVHSEYFRSVEEYTEAAKQADRILAYIRTYSPRYNDLKTPEDTSPSEESDTAIVAITDDESPQTQP